MCNKIVTTTLQIIKKQVGKTCINIREVKQYFESEQINQANKQEQKIIIYKYIRKKSSMIPK